MRAAVRPRYETAADLTNEATFEQLMLDNFGAVAHKLPVSYHVDYLVIADTGPLWVEFKRRRHTRGTYPDIILSALKWWHATSLADRTGASFAFVVQWDDCIGFCPWSAAKPWVPELDWGGRTKATRDTADIEPIVRLPVDRFMEL